MNKYWSNEDDKKVSYVTERPVRTPRVNNGYTPNEDTAPKQADSDAFSYSKRLNRPGGDETQAPRSATPQYGSDRSTFISDEANARQHREDLYAKPPRYTMSDAQGNPQNNGGYQLHSEYPSDSGDGRRGNFWLKFLIVILVLTIICGGAYIFRDEILTLVGNVFGEETVWKIVPTPAPTAVVVDKPAYVETTPIKAKSQATREISAVTGDLELDTYVVTEQNVVMLEEKQDGTYDFYLFDYDTGRLLGYYEGLEDIIPCAKHIFYIAEEPYLITARGFPLADLDALQRSAGNAVTISPMIGGWAIVKDETGTMHNYIGEDGSLISNLWYAKAFPFTADTTLAYVDTGNVTAAGKRFALYLLHSDGEAKRLSYVGDTDGILESVCGMAFTPDGGMLVQDDELTLFMQTDDVTAYVNCGALSVRDPETGLYGLFVDGVQQYPFTFDSIEPMPSGLTWEMAENGYITRCTVTGYSYPLPSSYTFVLRKGDTEQIISIAAVSEYPIIID